jgi:hypothetical protein
MKSIEDRLESFHTDMDILLAKLVVKEEQKNKIYSRLNKHNQFSQIKRVSTLAVGLCLCLVLLATVFQNAHIKQIKPNQKVQSIIIFKSKVELIEDADLIISGKVKDILPSKWSNPDLKKGENIRNILQTDISVKINDIFKGQPYNADSITVRIDKGSADGIKFESDGYPDFKENENVVLFLSKDDSDVANINENYYVLTGMLQGKFSLKDKDVYVSAADENTYIDLSTLKNDINKQLEFRKNNPKKTLSPEEIRKMNESVFGQ